MAADISTSISAHLTSKSLPPTQTWLTTFTASARPNLPLPSLQKTALFRLLASDLTTSILASPSNTLPATALSVTTKDQRLPGPIPLQVLDIEDVGRSTWSQVEALDSQDRGETTKGREVIRVVPGDAGENGTLLPDSNAGGGGEQTGKSAGPHKLLLQDANGTRIYGFELVAVEGVGVAMSIGAKLVLRDVVVARGVLLLEPACVELLGGKVEVWDKRWRTGRKEAMKAKVGATEEG